jgi:Spy/CpxP family protein refolding chaperone
MRIYMNNRGIISRLAGLALWLAPALLAQGPPMGIFPWWEGPIAAELNLTDAQKQQVETIQREYRGKMIDGRAEIAKAELTLDDTMNAEPFDLRKATDAASKASDARNDLTRNMTQMSLRLRAVLTKEQWQKTRARSQRPGFAGGGIGGGRGDGRGKGGPPNRPEGGRGPGGPGGPGGPPPNNQF